MRNDRAIFATIVSDAQTPFGASNERLRVSGRHHGKIVNIQFALAAEPDAFVADHPVPVRRARAGDADVSQGADKAFHHRLSTDFELLDALGMCLFQSVMELERARRPALRFPDRNW